MSKEDKTKGHILFRCRTGKIGIDDIKYYMNELRLMIIKMVMEMPEIGNKGIEIHVTIKNHEKGGTND